MAFITVNYIAGKGVGKIAGAVTLNPVGYMAVSGIIGVIGDKGADYLKTTFATPDSQKKYKTDNPKGEDKKNE